MRLVFLIPLLVACAAQTTQQRTSDREGALYWEYESRDGIPSGESRTYYPNGELRTVGSFLDAEFHGSFVAYRPDGEVAIKAFYWHDVLVWRSEVASAEPPEELLAELQTMTDTAEIRRRFGSPLRRSSMHDWLFDNQPPAPSFIYADWRASQRPVVGVRLGIGGSTAPDATGVSESVFGQVPFGPYAASAQLSQSQLHSSRGRRWGRTLLDVGGNRSWGLGLGRITARASVSAPIAGENARNSLATAGTVPQSPDMAVTAIGSTAALRASCSWLWQNERWGVQADLGADQAIGGDQTPSLTFLRTALAAAYGVRSLYGTLEFSTVGLLVGAQRQTISSVGIGGAFRALGVETKLLVGSSSDLELTGTVGVEHAF